MLCIAFFSSLSPWVKASNLVLDRAASVIEVTVKTTVGPFVSKFSSFNPDLTIDPTRGKVSGSVHFTMSDLKSNDDDRDMEIYMWMRTDQFPKADFILDQVTTDLKTGSSQAIGRLTVHGVQKQGSFPVAVSIRNKAITIEGTADIDTRDYALPVYRKFLVISADPHVHIHFKISGSVILP